MTEADRARILQRLEMTRGDIRCCGFYHPDDHAVLRALETEGLVSTWPGEGKDHGLLMARLAQKSAPPRLISGDGGGAA